MAIHTYSAVLKGKGRINSALIYLEKIPTEWDPNVIPIFLKPTSSSEKEWTKANISLDVVGKLDFALVVNAVSGTGWEFALTEKATGKKVVDLADKKTGTVLSNKSVETGVVDPS